MTPEQRLLASSEWSINVARARATAPRLTRFDPLSKMTPAIALVLRHRLIMRACGKLEAMRHDVIEVVEAYKAVCVDCVSFCVGEGLNAVLVTVRDQKDLELCDATCGRCGKKSRFVITARGTLRDRLAIADKPLTAAAAAAVIGGPMLAIPVYLAGKLVSHLFRGDKAEPYIESASISTKDVPNARPAPPAAFSQAPERLSLAERSCLPNIELIDAEWLDDKRRHIIWTLNKFDKPRQRDPGFARRVRRLRLAGQVRPEIESAIRSITDLRNRVVYDEYSLNDSDIERARSAWQTVESWSTTIAH